MAGGSSNAGISQSHLDTGPLTRIFCRFINVSPAYQRISTYACLIQNKHWNIDTTQLYGAILIFHMERTLRHLISMHYLFTYHFPPTLARIILGVQGKANDIHAAHHNSSPQDLFVHGKESNKYAMFIVFSGNVHYPTCYT